jgi:ADP-ribosylglycohydrolase
MLSERRSRRSMSAPTFSHEELLTQTVAPEPNLARREEAVVSSARWAAWADAIGFVTELTATREEVARRAGVEEVIEPVAWKRRIGGRFGPTIELPPGTYSDDTQLRLAVSRCIRSSGRFDAETFSKIELPVFLSYGLGVGRGTRTAAQALAKRGVRWLTNFYDEKQSRYVDGGGNGAAMRIQPHVWAGNDARSGLYLRDVVADAICTHGHLRGILGASFHAVLLGQSLRSGELPEPARWRGIARYLERLPDVIRRDEDLRERWLPLWEHRTGKTLNDALTNAIAELESQVQTAAAAASEEQPFMSSYAELARRLGGLSAKTRGAGTTSAVLSLWVAWRAQADPARTLASAANLHGSDTDTIATMAGGLVGAIRPERPPGAILDEDYIVREARRCAALARGETVEDFPHPDVVDWQAPRTLADAVGRGPEGVMVAGLGSAEEMSEIIEGASSRDDGGWQWLVLWFGQSLLVKRRRDLAPLSAGALPRARPMRLALDDYQPTLDDISEPSGTAVRADDAGAPPRERQQSAALRSGEPPTTIDAAIEFVKSSGFDPGQIGSIVLALLESDAGLERAAAFLGALAEAYRATRDRGQ